MGTTVQVWQTDPAVGLETARLDHEKPVANIAFSPNSRCITTIDSDGSKRIWDVTTGQEVDSLEIGQVGDFGAMSEDGRYWATSYGESYGPITISVRAMDQGRDVTHISYQGMGMNVMAFSPDNKWLATVGGYNASALWSVATGKQMTPINISNYVFDLAFSPDGKILAVSSGEPTIDFFGTVTILGLNHDVISNSVTLEPIATLKYEGPVYDLDFSPNGRWLATGSKDGTIQILEAATGQKANLIMLDDPVGKLNFSQDGHWLITTSRQGLINTIRVWRFTETGTESTPVLDEVSRMVYLGAVRNLVFSPDNEQLAFTDQNNSVRLWRWQPADLIAEACTRLPRNLTRQEWAQYIGHHQPYQATCNNLPTPALPSTGTVTPTTTPSPTPTPSPSATPVQVSLPETVISPENAKQIKVFRQSGEGDHRISSISLSPDGNLLASGGGRRLGPLISMA